MQLSEMHGAESFKAFFWYLVGKEIRVFCKIFFLKQVFKSASGNTYGRVHKFEKAAVVAS